MQFLYCDTQHVNEHKVFTNILKFNSQKCYLNVGLFYFLRDRGKCYTCLTVKISSFWILDVTYFWWLFPWPPFCFEGVVIYTEQINSLARLLGTHAKLLKLLAWLAEVKSEDQNWEEKGLKWCGTLGGARPASEMNLVFASRGSTCAITVPNVIHTRLTVFFFTNINYNISLKWFI